MEQETLFTASKWAILKLLSQKSLSPIELAAASSTSVANVSQQLRLLEMAGLVKSERVPNRDKGQPRILYSLAGNNSFLIATTDDFVQKKLFKLSAFNKIILKIWFYDKPELHYSLEKAFWHIEQHLDRIDALAVDKGAGNPVNMILFTRDETLKLNPLAVTCPDGSKRQVAFITTHPDRPEPAVLETELYAIHDPAGIIPELYAPHQKGGNTSEHR